MAVSKTEMKMIERKLNRMEADIMKLKAVLVPTVKMSKKEQRELEEIKRDMARGNWISGRELIKRLG
jgi:ATP-dependent protease ClpP protease subunit